LARPFKLGEAAARSGVLTAQNFVDADALGGERLA
jgi:hypothetical protein